MSDVIPMHQQKQMRQVTRELVVANKDAQALMGRLEAAVARVEAVADAVEAKRGPGRPKKAEVVGAA